MQDVTQILNQIEAGDQLAADKLLPLVYDELRKLAAARLAQEKPGQTLDATALVHEAFLKMFGGAASDYEDRGHFLGVAAMAMRLARWPASRSRMAAKKLADHQIHRRNNDGASKRAASARAKSDRLRGFVTCSPGCSGSPVMTAT